MLEFAAVTAAVASLTSVVDLADKVFDSWRKFRQSRTIEAPAEAAPDYYEKIAASAGGGLAHSAGGDVKVITREELSRRLGPQEKMVIEALETRMDILVSQWSAITAEYPLVIDAGQRAIYDKKLDRICVDLSKCLVQITRLLQDLGFELQDHYRAMRSIAMDRTLD